MCGSSCFTVRKNRGTSGCPGEYADSSVHQIEFDQLLVQHLQHLLIGCTVHTHEGFHVEVAYHVPHGMIGAQLEAAHHLGNKLPRFLVFVDIHQLGLNTHLALGEFHGTVIQLHITHGGEPVGSTFVAVVGLGQRVDLGLGSLPYQEWHGQ